MEPCLRTADDEVRNERHARGLPASGCKAATCTSAATKGRRALEELLQEVCEALWAPLPFRRGQANDRREIGELFIGLRRTLKEHAKSQLQAVEPILKHLEADVGATLNVAAHASRGRSGASEVKAALERIETLDALWSCPECRTRVWHKGTPDAARCRCGKSAFPPVSSSVLIRPLRPSARSGTTVDSVNRLGHYLVLEKLGSGGMGDVYVAEDTRLNRRVALKFLRREVADARDSRGLHPARSQSGGRSQSSQHRSPLLGRRSRRSRLHHDGARSGSQPASASGNRHGPPLAQTISFATQMAEALACAHAAGIVHRDLKPGNVMITDDERVKILDFGVAKVLARISTQDPEGATMTGDDASVGHAVGTTGYMSPEQALGRSARRAHGPVCTRSRRFRDGDRQSTVSRRYAWRRCSIIS